MWSVFQAASLTFAQRARCAATILLRPAADIVRRGFAFCFAQRAFCAKLILRRAAADMLCVPRFEPLMLRLPKAESAASMRWTSFCARSRSVLNCRTTTDRLPMSVPPRLKIIAGQGIAVRQISRLGFLFRSFCRGRNIFGPRPSVFQVLSQSDKIGKDCRHVYPEIF